jgi:hypothetical protein
MRTRFLLIMVAGLMAFPGLAAGERSGPEQPAKSPAAEAESAVSSPPMEMDDPGTPGPLGIEVNLVGSLERVGPGRELGALLDANLGIGDRLQLKYERPYVAEGADGEATQHGLDATEIGVKWRFLESRGLEAAIYPQYTFDDGFSRMDVEGETAERGGRSIYFPVLISERLKRVYTVAANFGYLKNLDAAENDGLVLALGGGRTMGRHARLLTEIYSDRDKHLHNRETDFRIGYVQSLFPGWLEASRVEIPAYVAVGRSLGHIAEGDHRTEFTFGLSILRVPAGD